MSTLPLPWIKMHTSLPTHRKSVELGMLLGKPLAWAHQAALLLWAGTYAQDGVIRGDRAEQLVEHAAQWDGPKGELVIALLTVGFLERQLGDDGYQSALIIHGWEEEQGAHVAKVLRDRAKNPPTSVASPAKPPRGDCAEVTGVEIEGELEKEEALKPLSGQPDQVELNARDVFAYWLKASGRTGRTAFDSHRRSRVLARLREGTTAAELCEAVDGCLATPHNRGENDRGERYDDLELICRSAANVDRFRRNARSPPKRPEHRGPGASWKTDWSGPPQLDATGQQEI